MTEASRDTPPGECVCYRREVNGVTLDGSSVYHEEYHHAITNSSSNLDKLYAWLYGLCNSTAKWPCENETYCTCKYMTYNTHFLQSEKIVSIAS